MSLAEVMTCVRENIPVVAVVFNNRQWGAEKKNQVDYFDNRYRRHQPRKPEFRRRGARDGRGRHTASSTATRSATR